jgi:hypothetical protein
MTLSSDEIARVGRAWPSDDGVLPVSVLAAVAAWRLVRLNDIDPAVRLLNDDPEVAFTTPARAFRKEAKCRTLVAHSVAAPGGPTPLPAELRSMVSSSDGPDPGAPPPSSVEAQLLALRMELDNAKATITHLARQQEESGVDASADYDVHDTVAEAVPKSFVSHGPLSKKDRQKVLREHMGIYAEGVWPNRLALSEATRNAKEIQSASKITLTHFAGEVSKFMERNDVTTKMAGTTWSRFLDIKDQVVAQLAADPDSTYRAAEVLQQLETLEGSVQSTFALGLDTSVHMRLNVSYQIVSTRRWASTICGWTPSRSKRMISYPTILIN